MNRSPYGRSSLAGSSPRSYLGNSPRDSVTSVTSTAGKLPRKDWDALDQRRSVQQGSSPPGASLPLDTSLPDVSRVPAPAPPGPYGQSLQAGPAWQHHNQGRLEPAGLGDVYSPRYVERGGSGRISGPMVAEEWGHVKLTSADGYVSYAGGLTSLSLQHPGVRPFTSKSLGIIADPAQDTHFGDGKMLGPPDGVAIGDLPHSAVAIPDVRRNLAETSLLDRAAARQSARDETLQEQRYRTEKVWLKVVIVSAHMLRAADEDTESSDPYCICEVPGRKDMKFRTPVVNQSLEPVWKHMHDFPEFSQTDSLRFSVYDQDPEWSELLGRGKLEPADLFPTGFSGRVKLTEAGTDHATLQVQVHVIRNEDAKHLARQAQNERELAAMKIQASMRGQQARLEAEAEKEELERHKKRGRELKAKEEREEKMRQEKYEQKRKDREIAEQRLRKIKEMQRDTAAITIQSWWRGWKFRRIVEHHIRLKKFEKEKARRKKEKTVLERRLEEESIEKERRKRRLEEKIRKVEAQWPTRAALRIQSWWRRVLLRRTVEYRLRKKEEAKKRQIEYEMREQRERFEREQERARNALVKRRQEEQEAAEAKIREMKEKQRVAAVVKLQSWRRGQLARRDHEDRMEAKRKAEEEEAERKAERRKLKEKERLAEQEKVAEARRREEEEKRREDLKRAQQVKDHAMMKLLQLEMKQQQKAVLMVQAARRGQLARRRKDELLQQKQAAAREKQKVAAAKKAEEFENRKREEAVAKIQRLVLGFAARCRVKALRRKKTAEQAAEAARKDKMAAAKRAREFKAKQRSDAVIKVQAVWRGRVQKRKYQQEVLRRKEETALERKRKERDAAKRKYYELDERRRQEAAKKIQSAFRGKQGRRNYSEKKRQKAEKEEIQKKEIRLAREAKEAEAKAKEKAKNDMVVKEKLAAVERQRKEQAAIVIQRLARGRRARKKYKQTKQEAEDREQTRRLKLQKDKEAKERREQEEARRRELEVAQQKAKELEHARRNKAATKLQRMARGFLARKDYQANLEQEKRRREREKAHREAKQETLRLEKLAVERQRAREAAERKLKVLEEKNRAEAATKIQAGWRGRVARQQLEEKRRRIAEVQRTRELERQAMLEYERRKALEKRQVEQAMKQKESVRERQRARKAAERKLEEMQHRTQSAAASKIQANVRRFLARKKYVRRKQRKDEEEKERRTKLEALRKDKEREAVERKLLDIEDRRRHQAATKIQAARRGQVARKDMAELKSKKLARERQQRLDRRAERERQLEEAEQKERRALEEQLKALDEAKRKREAKARAVELAHDDDAATKIQSVWRGRLTRQELKHRKKKAWNAAKADLYQDPAQEEFEMKLAQKRLEMEDRLRTKAEERRYDEFVKRQEMLAARLRQVREAADAKRMELEELEREKAAVKIQAFRRGRKVRREYEAELARRKEETRLLYEDSRRRAEDKRAWDLEYMRQDEAAVAIQSFFRGHRDRKRVADIRRQLWEEAEEELHRIEASRLPEDRAIHEIVIKIQRRWRRRKEQKEVVASRKRRSERVDGDEDKDTSSHLSEDEILEEDEMLVVLDKSSGDLWGLEVDTSSESETLRILDINGGLAVKWNLLNPDSPIMIGDEIVEVNGVRGGSGPMLAEIQQASILNIILKYRTESGSKNKKVMDKHQAARIIQAWWRGWKARRDLEAGQRISLRSLGGSSFSATEQAQLVASGKIQSLWRGVLARRISEAKKRRKDLGYRLRRPVGRRTLQGNENGLDSSLVGRPSLLGRLKRPSGRRTLTEEPRVSVLRTTQGDAPDVTAPSNKHRGSKLSAIEEASSDDGTEQTDRPDRGSFEDLIEKRSSALKELRNSKSDSPEPGDLPAIHPPLGWRPVPPTSTDKHKLEDIRYESAWRRSVERRAVEESGFPVYDHPEDDKEQQAAFTTHHQLSTMILEKKKEMQEQQQMLRKCRAEEERLRFLVSLSQDGQRCGRCDVRVANLAAILGALRRLTELLSLSTRRQTGAVMNGLAKVLDNVGHTNPHLAQLAAYVEESLLSSRGDGRRTYM